MLINRTTLGGRKFNVLDYGAVGNVVVNASQVYVSGTNDLTAFQAAIDAILVDGSGTLYIPRAPGGVGYYLEGQLNYGPGVGSFQDQFVVQGDAGGSTLIIAGTSGEYTFSTRNCWGSEVRDLIIRGKQPSGAFVDIGGFWGGRSVRAHFSNVWFLGLDCSRAPIVDNGVSMNRCFFGGCRSSGGFGVVTLIQWTTPTFDHCEWLDYGYHQGVNFSKPGSGSYVMLCDIQQAMAQPGTQRPYARFIACSFDEDSDTVVHHDPTLAGPDGPCLNPTGRAEGVLFDNCGWTASGGVAGHRCLKIKGARSLTVLDSFFGWSADPRHVMEVVDVDTSYLRNLHAIPGDVNQAFRPKVTFDALCGTVQIDEPMGVANGMLAIESDARRTNIFRDGVRWRMERADGVVVSDTLGKQSASTDRRVVQLGTGDAVADSVGVVRGGLPAVGSIELGGAFVNGNASLIDGETFGPISDGFASKTFEFDKTGNGVSGGNVVVNVTAATTNSLVIQAMIAAANGCGLFLRAEGTNARVYFYAMLPGTRANGTIADTVANTGFVPAAMAGGTNVAIGDYVIVSEPGQDVLVLAEASVIARGMNVTRSAATAGHVAALAGAGNYVGKTRTASPGTIAPVLVRMDAAYAP